MSYADDMCDIVVRHAGEKVRYFVHVEPDTNDQDLLYIRADLTWSDEQQAVIDGEVEELTAKEVYGERMGEDEVSQLIKVADHSVLFTGFIEEDVVVAQFDRGILSYLPDIVADFHEYMVANDIDFTALSIG